MLMDAKVKVKIGEVDSEIDSTIGVRQGLCEGPVLFLFIMQAAMETLEWPEGNRTVEQHSEFREFFIRLCSREFVMRDEHGSAFFFLCTLHLHSR